MVPSWDERAEREGLHGTPSSSTALLTAAAVAAARTVKRLWRRRGLLDRTSTTFSLPRPFPWYDPARVPSPRRHPPTITCGGGESCIVSRRRVVRVSLIRSVFFQFALAVPDSVRRSVVRSSDAGTVVKTACRLSSRVCASTKLFCRGSVRASVVTIRVRRPSGPYGPSVFARPWPVYCGPSASASAADDALRWLRRRRITTLASLPSGKYHLPPASGPT